MKRRTPSLFLLMLLILLFVPHLVYAWTPVPVKDDPLVRMPGSQPPSENNITLEGPGRCSNCHGGYNSAVEPDYNWRGSMMAQAARDFLFWSCLMVAAQDSIYAIGRPNATDICLSCHAPKGRIEGRSDPTNGSALTGDDFAGVQCDFCHDMFDPFFEGTYSGVREGSDWLGYWDETNRSITPSSQAALNTYNADKTVAQPYFFLTVASSTVLIIIRLARIIMKTLQVNTSSQVCAQKELPSQMQAQGIPCITAAIINLIIFALHATMFQILFLQT